MTWGHCDSCRWRWVPWAGPCKHPAPAEGQECIGFSPDKSRLYTTNGNSNDISVIDVASRKVVKSVPVGEQPWGVVAIDE